MRYTAPAGQAGLLSFRRAWKQVPLHELHNTQTEYITMKKSIITLMALAGMAAAGEIQSWDLMFTDGNQSITGSNRDLWAEDGLVLSSYMFDFTVDSYTSTGNSVTTVLTYRGDMGTTGERQGMSFLTWGGTNVGIGNGSTHYNIDENKATFAADDVFRFAFNAENKTGYLYNVTQDKMCVADMSADITAENISKYYFTSGVKGVQATIGSSVVWTNSGGGQFTMGDLYDLSSLASNAAQFENFVKTKPIPEPATATLSLLALAGLAARRRRH